MPMSEKMLYIWLSSFTSDYFNDVIYLFHSTCRTMFLGAKYGKKLRSCVLIIFQTLQTNQVDSLLSQLWTYKWNTWQQSQNPRKIPTTISVITLILTNSIKATLFQRLSQQFICLYLTLSLTSFSITQTLCKSSFTTSMKLLCGLRLFLLPGSYFVQYISHPSSAHVRASSALPL